MGHKDSISKYIVNVKLFSYITREKILTKILSDAFLVRQIVSGPEFQDLRNFTKWNTEQYVFYILNNKCPNNLLSHKELIHWENKIIEHIPYGIVGNIKHLL